jgi:peptidoglycan/xylan/chitin deacetylase (PgdA/CDA1 family)
MQPLSLAVPASLAAVLVLALVAQVILAPAARALPPAADGGGLAAESADTQPPVTLAEGADEGWHAKAVTIRFEASDDLSGVAATYYALDDGAWTQGASFVVAAPKDHSNDGVHSLRYASVDNAGNRETEKQASVKIDTTLPGFTWVSLVPSLMYGTRNIELRFTIREASGSVGVGWRMTDQYGSYARARGGLERDPGERVVTLSTRYASGSPLLPGLYRIRVTLKDAAGNTTVSPSRAFRLYRPVEARVWRRVDGAGKRVALTFDDGGSDAWRSILTTLKAYGAHATFFPLGPSAASAPGLMCRTRSEGHAIGSHGWTHKLMSCLSYDGVRSELLRAQAPWWDAARATPVPYVRPPYGDYSPTALSAAGSLGYARVILWDVDPQDWASPGSSVIASRVLSSVRPGSIVLLHLRAQTAAALPTILRGLKARGFQVVTVPKLFRAAGYH